MSRRLSPVRASSGRGSAMTSSDELCLGNPLNITLCCLAAILASLITASIQSGFFFQIRPFGIAPDLCLCFTVAAGLLFGSRFGGVAGVSAGIFIDAMTSGGFSLNILFYMACGIAVGFIRISEPRPIKDLWRYISVLICAAGVRQLFLALWVTVTAPSPNLLRLISDLLIKEIFCTALFSIPVFLITVAAFWIRRRLKARK